MSSARMKTGADGRPSTPGGSCNPRHSVSAVVRAAPDPRTEVKPPPQLLVDAANRAMSCAPLTTWSAAASRTARALLASCATASPTEAFASW